MGSLYYSIYNTINNGTGKISNILPLINCFLDEQCDDFDKSPPKFMSEQKQLAIFRRILKEINSKNIDYSTKINRIKKHLLGRTLRGSIHTKKLPSSISRPLQEDRMYTKECISKMKKLNTKNKLQDNDIMDLCVKLNHISIGNWEIRY